MNRTFVDPDHPRCWIPQDRNLLDRLNPPPEEKLGQVGQVSGGGRGNTGGEAAACRDLGVTRQTARRAEAIVSISPEAMETAQELGLADKQAELLEVARDEPQRQVAKGRRR